MYRNRNRGYRHLRVWQDAIDLYVGVCRVFRGWAYEVRRVAGNQIASADSVHRNIAEGHCRHHIREYIQHLNIALGSLGETVSGLAAYRSAGQMEEDDFNKLDTLAYKLENGLLAMVKGLESKRDNEASDRADRIRESNVLYGSPNTPSPHHPIAPFPRFPFISQPLR